MNPNFFLSYIHRVLPVSLVEANQILTFYTSEVLSAKTSLLQPGRVCEAVYFVESGFARSFTFDSEGNEITTELYGVGDYANDFISFFRRTPAMEAFETMSECVVWKITYDDVQTAFHGMPTFREYGRLLLIQNYARLKTRTLSMIQLNAEQRYAKLINENPSVFQHVPLNNISYYLGITDSSLSRIRKNFSKQK